MMPISFVNPREIDLSGALLFGLSAKETENPIGMFGTGLKFAIATLLRTGHAVTIFSGEQEYPISTRPVVFRGTHTNAVLIGDTEGGFATSLGSQWPVWAAYRELASNAYDEGGVVTDRNVLPSAGMTIIRVVGSEMETVYRDRERYILPKDLTSVIFNSNCEVYERASDGLYYRGIRVADHEPMPWTFNIQAQMRLSEDRQLASPWLAYEIMAKAIFGSHNTDLIKWIMTDKAGERIYGATFGLQKNEYSSTAFEVIKELYASQPVAVAAHIKKLFRVELADKSHIVVPGNIESKMIEAARTHLSAMGFPDLGPIEISVQERDVLGFVEDNCIMISRSVFRQGMSCLVATILEEHFHISGGYLDKTRRFQNRLLEEIVRQYELGLGEPL